MRACRTAREISVGGLRSGHPNIRPSASDHRAGCCVKVETGGPDHESIPVGSEVVKPKLSEGLCQARGESQFERGRFHYLPSVESSKSAF